MTLKTEMDLIHVAIVEKETYKMIQVILGIFLNEFVMLKGIIKTHKTIPFIKRTFVNCIENITFCNSKIFHAFSSGTFYSKSIDSLFIRIS